MVFLDDEAGSWNSVFCSRIGPLAEIGVISQQWQASNFAHSSEVVTRCWHKTLHGWDFRRQFLSHAWSCESSESSCFVSRAAGRSKSEAEAFCSMVGDGWALLAVTLDLPLYIKDVRGCGRGSRDIWGPVEGLYKLAKNEGFESRQDLLLCLPARWCSASELAAFAVPLWIARTFSFTENFHVLPGLQRVHANITDDGGLVPPWSHRPCARSPEGWVYVYTRGRLGNVLMDVANGLAVALQTRRKGLVLDSPMMYTADMQDGGQLATASEDEDLFGLRHGVRFELSEPIWRDLVISVASPSTRRMACGFDSGDRTRLAQVSATTHWAAAPFDGYCGNFPSCALPIVFRRQLLRTAMLPRLALQHACFVGHRSQNDDDEARTLTVHLRGGDAVPAMSPDHAQPPCAVYDIAIREHSFDKIRIISEDARNPCLGYLLERHGSRVSFARVGGSLREDTCALLDARNLFLAASSLSVSLALLGNAAVIFLMLPWRNARPGVVPLGFPAEAFLSQLCDTFEGNAVKMRSAGGSVFAFQPDDSYYWGDGPVQFGVPGNENMHHFKGVPRERTLSFPEKGIRIRHCNEA